MEKRESIMLAVFLIIFVAGLLAFMFRNAASVDRAADSITSAEIEVIQADLIRRGAEDCVLTRTDYGWRCEQHDGKIFKVKVR